DLETAAQRSRRAEFVRRESVPRKASPLHPRRALSLRIRATGKSRTQLVEARATGPLAAAVVRRRSAFARFVETGGLARKHKFGSAVSLRAESRGDQPITLLTTS